MASLCLCTVFITFLFFVRILVVLAWGGSGAGAFGALQPPPPPGSPFTPSRFAFYTHTSMPNSAASSGEFAIVTIDRGGELGGGGGEEAGRPPREATML